MPTNKSDTDHDLSQFDVLEEDIARLQDELEAASHYDPFQRSEDISSDKFVAELEEMKFPDVAEVAGELDRLDAELIKLNGLGLSGLAAHLKTVNSVMRHINNDTLGSVDGSSAVKQLDASVAKLKRQKQMAKLARALAKRTRH